MNMINSALKKFLVVVLVFFSALMISFEIKANENNNIINEFTNIQTKMSLRVNYKYSIYNLLSGKRTYEINSIDIQYEAIISLELYNKLIELGDKVSFGICPVKKSVLEGTGLSFEEYVCSENGGSMACNVKRVNENLEVDEEGNYYRLYLSILRGQLKDIDSILVSTFFVSVDNKKFLMKESVYSMRELASEYLKGDTTEFKRYIEVLKFINVYADDEE